MMEDSSLLKVRSDLYPYAAHPANTMTSNSTMTADNITCNTMPTNNMTNTNTTTATTNIMTSSLITISSSSSSSSVASVTNKESNVSAKDHDPWRRENKEHCRSSPTFKEEQTFRPRDWNPSSSESCFVCHERTNASSEHGATPPETPTDPSGEVTKRFNDNHNGNPAHKTKDNPQIPEANRSPNHVPMLKVQSPPMFPHGMSFHLPPHAHEINIVSTENPIAKESPRPLPTPPDDVPYPGIQHASAVKKIALKYDNTSPRNERQSSGEACGDTLDLSTSSRSKDAFPPQPSQVVSPPAVSPSPFNPFGVFPGLARFHEMNPVFREGFEAAIPKPLYTSSLYAANLPPHLLPWLISSQIQNLVQHQQATRNEGNRGNIFGNCNGGFLLEEKDQQPLDLSAKKHDSKSLSHEDIVARVLDIKPSTRGRRRADNSKKSYTEDELHAALRDIQSGKLGTRRAAVIYGIPRSTLRNKVYKLQSVRDHNKRVIDQKEKVPPILPDSTAHLHSPLMLSKTSESDSQAEIPCEALKSMLRKKMTEKLEELSRNSQTYLSGGDKQKLLDSVLMYLCENIPKLALNTDNKTTPSEILSSLSLYPQLQDFTHKIVEERFYEEIKKINNNTNDPALPEISNGYNSEVGNPPLNIPSYPSLYKNQPNDLLIRSEGIKSDSSHPSIGSPPQTNLKDMIAQIINQKILGDNAPVELPASNSSAPFLPLPVQRMESSFLKTNLKLPTEEKPQQDQNKKRAKSPSSGGGKGSRPKRGKYRNYDRDNLLKAVQAVQSGEMSVHRAGSFYGVPHSTLEYKVKERHLNRGRNKKEGGILTNIPLLKSEKENASLNASLASTAFSKEQFKNDTPDTTTKDLASADNRSNNEISIISVQSPPSKRTKLSNEQDEPFSSLPITSNPFLSNPFPFWNNASPILAPFLTSPYQTDPLYASQVMSNFQKAASKLNASELRNNSPSPNHSDTKHSESFPTEASNKALGLSSNGGSVSSTPPSSPPIHDGLLNTLLRKKMETQLNENSLPWQIPPNEGHAEDPKEPNSDLESNVIPPAGLFTLKALLPSFIAARTSLEAAISAENSNPNTSRIASSSPQPANPLPLIKGSPHIPIVGGASLSEAP